MDLDDDPWGEASRPSSSLPAPSVPTAASLSVTTSPESNLISSTANANANPDVASFDPHASGAPPEYLFVDEDSPSQQPARLTRDATFSSSSSTGNGHSPRENVKLFQQKHGSSDAGGDPRNSSDFGGRQQPGSPLASPTSLGSGGHFLGGSDDEAVYASSSDARASRRAAPGVYRGPRNPDTRDNYDPHTAEFAQESTGRRVAYENFTTIDWIHVGC
jgi:hypothetical protein